MALLLNQNQPNPFDGQTLIPFTLGQQTKRMIIAK
jgi:hypothetical protein